ncbi:MAG TPA: hypothetical protein VK689_00040, partial [Armatimonadota bacterium]|nr:hypothetical protein [Armatimonadota bacterium]
MRSTCRHYRSGILLLFGALAAVAGCGSPPDKQPAGSVLRLAQVVEPTSLDPALVQDGPTIELIMHVFEGLVQWTPQNKLAPALATKWAVSNGGKTY